MLKRKVGSERSKIIDDEFFDGENDVVATFMDTFNTRFFRITHLRTYVTQLNSHCMRVGFDEILNTLSEKLDERDAIFVDIITEKETNVTSSTLLKIAEIFTVFPCKQETCDTYKTCLRILTERSTRVDDF